MSGEGRRRKEGWDLVLHGVGVGGGGGGVEECCLELKEGKLKGWDLSNWDMTKCPWGKKA